MARKSSDPSSQYSGCVYNYISTQTCLSHDLLSFQSRVQPAASSTPLQLASVWCPLQATHWQLHTMSSSQSYYIQTTALHFEASGLIQKAAVTSQSSWADSLFLAASVSFHLSNMVIGRWFTWSCCLAILLFLFFFFFVSPVAHIQLSNCI